MPSTFFGLSIASTGLNAFNASVNTTAHNISNAKTAGYSKQTVNLKSGQAVRVAAKYGSQGTGVSADSVTQMRDKYYDEKYWNNQSNYGQYDKKYYYMKQVETYFTDNAANPGFTTLYTEMFNALNALQANSGDTSARMEFISDAKKLTNYFNDMSAKLEELQTSVNDEIKTTVDSVNATAKKIAEINRQINQIEQQGGHANELRDERAILVDNLSQVIPVSVDEKEVSNTHYPDMKTGATIYRLTVNGKTLVDNYEYSQLKTTTRKHPDNQSDVEGLYDIAWADTGEKLTVNNGTLSAMIAVRDGNNGENLKGTISALETVDGVSTITIKDPTITNINSMNLPDRGNLKINNTNYQYDSFEFTTDDAGNITGYTFTLTDSLEHDVQIPSEGDTVVVGSSVDFKGIAYYQNQMNLFLRNFAQEFNSVQQTGYYTDETAVDGTVGLDLNGNPMGAFFVTKSSASQAEKEKAQEGAFSEGLGKSLLKTTLKNSSETYYRLTAKNIDVAAKTQNNPKVFAATTQVKRADGTTDAMGVDQSDLVKKLLKLQGDKTVFRDDGGDSFLQSIYADISVDAQECKVFSSNYKQISTAIDEQRQSVSGVDEDEEALDLVKFQNAYYLASKAIQTLSEMYDRLITQTGV